MTKPLEFGDLEVDDADLVVTTNSPSPQLVVVKGPAITPAVVPLPLNWVDMSNWDNDPIPEREWAIRDRVPANQVGLFSGEGGTGKSITELQKKIAHVTGKDWLGSMPEPGPAIYVGAEDESAEL
jgi:hypothetical protein